MDWSNLKQRVSKQIFIFNKIVNRGSPNFGLSEKLGIKADKIKNVLLISNGPTRSGETIEQLNSLLCFNKC